jgi:hypothetical protein
MELKLLTQEQMAQEKCESPGCTASHELYITQRCHPKAGLVVCYDRGVLHMTCAQCKTMVSKFLVAERDMEN